MIINTVTTIALRCPECARLSLYPVSRFSFSNNKTQEIVCSCGTPQVVMVTRNKKSYWLEINCVVCESTHFYRLKAKELWSHNVIHLSCQETGLELGHIGPHQKVQAYLEKNEDALEALIEEMGGEEYFQSAEIMLSTLTHVHTLAEEGGLICPCGKNRIELEIFPERVELHCRHCKRMRLLAAKTQQDLERLHKMEKIELSRQVFGEDPVNNPRRRRDNKW
ncbi:MAG: hypothetical protein H0Z39_01795 [Peptococcaceae bacterium]|nr:hypothetical protein [Peptococcaceae bacterium]